MNGSYDFAAPLNGSAAIAATAYHDTTAVDGTSYRYTVRAVSAGAGGAQVESDSGPESNSVAGDATAPPALSAVAVTNGGNVLAAPACGYNTGTQFVNAAGQGALAVTVSVAVPEAGERVVFSATTPGSTAVTASVPVTGTSVVASLNLRSLRDGVVTLTAQAADAAGNLSASIAPANVIVKDVVPAPLSDLLYTDALLFGDSLGGSSECGATVTALETAGPHLGSSFPAGGPLPVGPAGWFSDLTVDAVMLMSYGYQVTATDLAGNAGSPVTISGFDLL